MTIETLTYVYGTLVDLEDIGGVPKMKEGMDEEFEDIIVEYHLGFLHYETQKGKSARVWDWMDYESLSPLMQNLLLLAESGDIVILPLPHDVQEDMKEQMAYPVVIGLKLHEQKVYDTFSPTFFQDMGERLLEMQKEYADNSVLEELHQKCGEFQILTVANDCACCS